MKAITTITVNEDLKIPVMGARFDKQGDICLTVDRATKKLLSEIAGFPVHTVAITKEDFNCGFDFSECTLVLERKGAGKSGSMPDYEENSMMFSLSDQSKEYLSLCIHCADAIA